MTVVRAALVQTTWTGDKDSMIDKHEEYAREAAAQGAQVICFQELFYGPYFCQVQDSKFYEYAEAVPGPTTERFQALAEELGWSSSCRSTSRRSRVLYNTAAVIDADGSYLGKYRKQHIPHVSGFWEKFYFRPGNGGYPVFDTAVGKVGVYICYDRHFPEGWRALGLNGAQIVFNPSATSRGLSEYLWSIEQPAAAVANEYYVGAINRVGIEDLGDDDFYGQSYFVDPEGNYVGDKGDAHKPELIVRDLDLDLIQTVRERWAFYRDRRPEAYGDGSPEPVARSRGARHDHADRRRHRRLADRPRSRLTSSSTARRSRRSSRPAAPPWAATSRAPLTPSSTRPASTSSPAASTATPTWSCRSAGPTPPTPSRAAHRRGLGRDDDDHRLRGAAHRRAGPGRARRLARQGRRQLRDRLRLPPDPRRRGRRRTQGDGRAGRRRDHQLQAVHGLSRRLLLRRRPDPPGDAAGRARTAR